MNAIDNSKRTLTQADVNAIADVAVQRRICEEFGRQIRANRWGENTG